MAADITNTDQLQNVEKAPTGDLTPEQLQQVIEYLKNNKDKLDLDKHELYNPPGVICQFVSSSIPEGWLLCNGQAVSRSTYAALYGVIGDTYGPGDETTTFNLPDLQGKVPVGLGGSPFGLLGTIYGNLTILDPDHQHQNLHTHTTIVPNHTHTATPGTSNTGDGDSAPTTDQTATFRQVNAGTSTNVSYRKHTHALPAYAVSQSGSSTIESSGQNSTYGNNTSEVINWIDSRTLNVVQPSLVVNFIIKY